MNKQHKKFDVSKMTEFKPSQTILYQDDFDPNKQEEIKEDEIQEKYVKYDQSTAKAFDLID